MNATEQHGQVYSYIGQRIRERRKTLKMNQGELAELMGFSYQQMQKYEKGVSHLSAGKLLLFAKIMNVPPGYFYEGINLEEAIGKRIDSHIIQSHRNRALRILLVESNPADVLLFHKAMGNQSNSVDLHVIHDAEMVMDFLQNHETKFNKKAPDIIILGLSLPKMNGIDILKSVKRMPKKMEIPVIVLANSINVKDMMGAYKNGAAGFIQKSVELEEYAESMEALIKYWSKTVVLPCA